MSSLSRNLKAGRKSVKCVPNATTARGEVRGDIDEVHAWAIVGMNVFLGLRYGVWSNDRSIADVAHIANELIRAGLAPR